MNADETQTELQMQHDQLRERLTLLADNFELGPTPAAGWRDVLDIVEANAKAPRSLAFIAGVGRGKSSLIAAASGLRLDRAGTPNQWSVLPVGPGRTTLGEMRVCFEERDDILVEVEPFAADELETEVRIFAQDQWEAVTKSGRGNKGKAGEEFNGLLRAWLAPDAEDDWEAVEHQVRNHDSLVALERAWLEAIDLELRSQALRQTFAGDAEGHAALRKLLEELMQGRLPDAPAPRSTCLHLPITELGREFGTIIDTQGIDGEPGTWLNAREDLLGLIANENVAIVVCSNFKDAPDSVSVSVLEALPRGSFESQSVRLVIVDDRRPDTTEQRRSATRRRNQCHNQLRSRGIELPKSSIAVIDICSQAEDFHELLVSMAREGRLHALQLWRESLELASEAIASLANEEFAASTRELDLRLRWAWDAGVAEHQVEAPNALTALAQALSEGEFHWSQLYATTRRRGRYFRLDLATIGARAIAETTVSGYNAAHEQLSSAAAALSQGADEALARHVDMRSKQFDVVLARHSIQLFRRWRRALTTYFRSHQSRGLWRDCVARWGGGGGYVDDVVARFRAEAERTTLVTSPLRPIESRLPQRPWLFSVQRVRLHDFRGISEGAVELDPATTVLIGDNAAGKTSWLEAIAAGIGTFLPGIGVGPAPTLNEADVRQVIRETGGTVERALPRPMAIEIDAMVHGHSLKWARRVHNFPVDGVTNEADGLELEARRAGEEVRAGERRQLPVLAYYGTQRLWPADLAANQSRREIANRLDGYRECLDAASNHRDLLDWMRQQTYAELQKRAPIAQLQAVQRAVTSCIAEAESFAYDVQREQLVLRIKGEPLLFDMLSDGYRNMVAMVADIAWRAVVLNPELRALAPELAEGVVLIDEIDLHLHPRWQRRVLADLRRAFPRLQFIATTHSPFIVQSLAPGQLVNLDPDVEGGDYANESPEDITERHMGVVLPQRSERRRQEYEVATQYYDLLAQLPDADRVELARLKARLDELLAPYADNQAFVVFLQRKRALAEAPNPGQT